MALPAQDTDNPVAGGTIVAATDQHEIATINATIVQAGLDETAAAAEVTRATAAEATKAAVSALTAEQTRATGAEGTNATAVTAEQTRALAAEALRATTAALTAETTRAQAAETANATAVATNASSITTLQNQVAQLQSIVGTRPGAPTGVTATGGVSQASVTFTAPSVVGSSAITSYTATAYTAGGTVAGYSSAASTPIAVALSSGTYTFTVTATNGAGTGPVSTSSAAVNVTAPSYAAAFTLPTARQWLSGYTAGDVTSVGQNLWAGAFNMPQAIGSYFDWTTSFAQINTNLGTFPNIAPFAGSNTPGAPINLLTVGLIPHTTSGDGYTTQNQTALANAATGANNSSWQTIGATLVSSGRNFKNTVIRLGHEANGNWYPWAHNNVAAQMVNYVAAFQAAVTAMRAGGATNVRFDMCYNASNGGQATIASSYPGDAYVDVISIDWYNFGDNTTPAGFAGSQGTLGFPQLSAFAAAHGKMFGIGEWGLDNTSVQTVRDVGAIPQWIYSQLAGMDATYGNGFVSHDVFFNNAPYGQITGTVNPLTSAAYKSSWTAGATNSGLSVPGAPTGVAATTTGTTGQLSVAFTAPASTGGSAITEYVVFSNGPTATIAVGTSSPILLSNVGLGSYAPTVVAVNSLGSSAASAASAPVSVTGTTGANILPAGVADTTGGTAVFTAVTTSGTVPTLSVDTTQFRAPGVQSIKAVATTAAGLSVSTKNTANVTAGTPITVLGSVRMGTAQSAVGLQITWSNSSFAYLSNTRSASETTAPVGTWVDLILTATPPANAAKATFQINNDSTPAVGDVMNVGQFELAVGSGINTWSAGV